MNAIEIFGVTKFLGKKREITALNKIDLQVKEGKLFGLIGPDGAGKTTLHRILTTLLIPEIGEAFVLQKHTVRDWKEIRKCVGYMPGKFSLYQDLSVEENLQFFAHVFNTTLEKNYFLIKDIYQQIEPFKTRKAGKLSGGMKQKLALCCALIHKPEVLFLDEPTTGVDAVSRKEFWEMLKNIQQNGITILVSTPYMDEAEMCNEIALIQKGNILGIETPQNIKKSFNKPLVAAKSKNMLELLNRLNESEQVERAYPFGEFHHVVLKKDFSVKQFQTMFTLPQSTIEWKNAEANIEDCFIDRMLTL